MAEIWIWNSMARRRRSASDTFEENGIQIIKTYLSSHHHTVRMIDWATDEGFHSLSPRLLRGLNRVVVEKVMAPNASKLNKLLLGALCSITQALLSRFQWIRMAGKLKDLAAESKQKGLRIFGIKVWYGEAFYWSKYLTRQIQKYNPECVVIAGGYHASLYEEDILKFSNFDIAVINEGELTLSRLLKLVDDAFETNNNPGKSDILSLFHAECSKGNLPGVIYRDNGIIKQVKRVPQKNHTRILPSTPQYQENSGKIKVHILLDSLGCPWGKCNFCVHHQFTSTYQAFHIETILNEIKTILKQGIALFRFTGSDTTYTHGKTIAESLLKHGYTIEYSMGARAVKNCDDNTIYRSVVDAYATMINAGLRAVFIGGECGNDSVNHKIMNKGINKQDIISTIKAIREASSIVNKSIAISLALIYPTPIIGEMTDEIVFADNISLLEAAKPDSAVISPPGPFKKSTWYEKRDKFGFDLTESFIQTFMEFEYVLYKPPHMWPEIGISLNGRSFKDVLLESGRFQRFVESELNIPCNLCDEHFMMMHAANIRKKDDIDTFKRKSQISIISADYSYLQSISEKVNRYSKALASRNLTLIN